MSTDRKQRQILSVLVLAISLLSGCGTQQTGTQTAHEIVIPEYPSADKARIGAYDYAFNLHNANMAEAIIKKWLPDAEKEPDGKDKARFYGTYSFVLYQENKYKEMEPYAVKALEMVDKLPPNDRPTPKFMCYIAGNMAMVKQNSKQLPEAEKYWKEACEYIKASDLPTPEKKRFFNYYCNLLAMEKKHDESVAVRKEMGQL